jgi:hypothetical protein
LIRHGRAWPGHPQRVNGLPARRRRPARMPGSQAGHDDEKAKRTYSAATPV